MTCEPCEKKITKFYTNGIIQWGKQKLYVKLQDRINKYNCDKFLTLWAWMIKCKSCKDKEEIAYTGKCKEEIKKEKEWMNREEKEWIEKYGGAIPHSLLVDPLSALYRKY